MIVHTVIFRLARPVSDAETAVFVAHCEAFADTAPHVLERPKVSVDLGLRPEGRSVSEVQMVVHFADVEAFRAYLTDPLHVAFAQDVLIPSCETWLSVQAEV